MRQRSALNDDSPALKPRVLNGLPGRIVSAHGVWHEIIFHGLPNGWNCGRCAGRRVCGRGVHAHIYARHICATDRNINRLPTAVYVAHAWNGYRVIAIGDIGKTKIARHQIGLSRIPAGVERHRHPALAAKAGGKLCHMPKDGVC